MVCRAFFPAEVLFVASYRSLCEDWLCGPCKQLWSGRG